MAYYSTFAADNAAHGIMFHHFHGAGHPAVQGSIDPNQLADMIDFLGGNTRVLDARTWMEKALSGRLEQGDLCLTFDDSLLCQIDVAVPVLRALGHTGFFFVYSSVFEGHLERLEIYRAFRTRLFDSVEDFYNRFFEAVEQSSYRDAYSAAIKDFSPARYLAEFSLFSDGDRKFRFVRDRVLDRDGYEQLMDGMIETVTSLAALSQSLWMKNQHLQELTGEGHVVGLHSYTHPMMLAELPAAEQEWEYGRNVEHLKALLRTAPISLSHPSNSYDATTLKILRRLGVQLGFRANMTEPKGSDLEFPREDHSNILTMMRKA